MGRWTSSKRMGLVSLALGVVTTYGVAWSTSCASLRRDPRMWEGNILSDGERGWHSRVERHFGVTSCRSLIVRPHGHEALVSGTAGPRDELPAWSVIGKRSPSELVGTTSSSIDSCVLERLAGWPARATVERSYFPPYPAGPVSVPSRDLTVYAYFGPNPMGGVSLAFLPAWPGFAVDVAFYGAAWFGLLLSAREVRRRMRLRVGLCPKCRYDLSGLVGGVCPECGNAAARPASTLESSAAA
jgi:hypothetical protein